MGPGLLYADNGTAEEGTVETWTTENIWVYDPPVLVVVYAVAAMVDLLVICVGLWAMASNGGTISGFEFARIVATTKGLDRELVQDWEDGLDPIPKKIEETRVKYGVIEDGGGRRRVGFGLDEVVVERLS